MGTFQVKSWHHEESFRMRINLLWDSNVFLLMFFIGKSICVYTRTHKVFYLQVSAADGPTFNCVSQGNVLTCDLVVMMWPLQSLCNNDLAPIQWNWCDCHFSFTLAGYTCFLISVSKVQNVTECLYRMTGLVSRSH